MTLNALAPLFPDLEAKLTAGQSDVQGADIIGTEDGDTLNGTGLSEVIEGLGGDDFIVSNGGVDTVDGGAGVDLLDLSALQDTAGRQAGQYRLDVDWDAGTATSHDGLDVIEFANIEWLALSDFEDRAIGGVGDDYIWGMGGDDLLEGRDGMDSLTGGEGADTLLGQDGDDRLWGGGGADSLVSGLGNDWVNAMNGNDYAYGNAGNDYLFGGGGRDRLRGNNGDDTLVGGEKNDFLQGGAGADVFVFGNTVNGEGQWGKDLIKDFEIGVDTIVLADFTVAPDITWKNKADGTGVIARIADKGAIVFQGHSKDDLDDLADWIITADDSLLI